ncbi:hypothetical protein [Marinobacterium sp. BA1]|uniref:hypothetical protein n=1 Tax=Marinobacterium sp. BA1 TaxID=3138931 RepID=UPI0032E5FE3B
MSRQKLPDGAYAALEGLKAQADAAMMMVPGKNKAEGKKALAVAHAKIAANEEWAKKIVNAIMIGDGQKTVATADSEWLERTFTEHSD